MLQENNVNLEEDKIEGVTWLDKEEKLKIENFLLGAVYCWCNNQGEKWFSARDFLSKENSSWIGTPLIVLNEKHKKDGKEEKYCKEEAGKEAGRLLKETLYYNTRHFETRTGDNIREYRWIK